MIHNYGLAQNTLKIGHSTLSVCIFKTELERRNEETGQTPY